MAPKAKESPQVQKARNKIKKQLANVDKQIDPASLKKMSLLIQRQILRHRQERIDLATKSITLFDENTHSAKIQSRFVNRLLKELQHPKKSKHKNNLEGRITAVG